MRSCSETGATQAKAGRKAATADLERANGVQVLRLDLGLLVRNELKSMDDTTHKNRVSREAVVFGETAQTA